MDVGTEVPILIDINEVGPGSGPARDFLQRGSRRVAGLRGPRPRRIVSYAQGSRVVVRRVELVRVRRHVRGPRLDPEHFFRRFAGAKTGVLHSVYSLRAGAAVRGARTRWQTALQRCGGCPGRPQKRRPRHLRGPRAPRRYRCGRGRPGGGRRGAAPARRPLDDVARLDAARPGTTPSPPAPRPPWRSRRTASSSPGAAAPGGRQAGGWRCRCGGPR